jgi:hypothetical protein
VASKVVATRHLFSKKTPITPVSSVDQLLLKASRRVLSAFNLERLMAAKKKKKRYGKKASKKVARAMHERKRGELKSGRSGKKVKSRKQAIAIALSEARKAGAKVPRTGKKGGKKAGSKKRASKKKTKSRAKKKR